MGAGMVALEPARPEDAGFMALAIEAARQARFPFGAVIVRDGTVLASGRNRGGERGDPTAHAELEVIRDAVTAHGAAALNGATLYASGEPCPMCMGAILWCGFGRVVFGASVAQLSTRLDQIMLDSATVAAAGFRPVAITGGVLADQAIALF